MKAQWTMMAPGATNAGSAVDCPGNVRPSIPAIDDRLVEPETEHQMMRGKLVALPADAAHGDRHCELDYVLRACVAPGYVAATDLLTRTSADWDFATDTCIRREGIDPASGRRYLEELAFEVKHTQRPGDLTERAWQLARRGVRRIFAIWVAKRADGKVIAGPVREWSSAQGTWVTLDQDDEIVDRCLSRPIKIKALLHAAEAHDAVARALLAQGNPVLVKAQADSYAQGKSAGLGEGEAIGLRDAVRAVCEVLGIELSPERTSLLEVADADKLRALIAAIRMQRAWPTG